MRLVFMGTPEIALPVLRVLAEQHEIAAVYTRPDAPAGRGRRLVSSAVKQAADELGLRVEQPETFREPVAISALKALKPEVIVVVAYGRILPRPVLEIPPLGCINVHFSLLPRHRGASPVAGAILAGDVFTGISLMLMDRGLDTGPLLSQCQIPVLDSDNTRSLGKRLSLIAAGMVSATLPEWAQGLIQPRQQDNELATYSGLIVREAGCMDWQDSAEDLWRKSRAYFPWPGIYTTWKGRKLKLIRTVPVKTGPTGTAGSVVPLDGTGGAWFGITTAEGILGVISLQIEGKSEVASAEFLHGRPGIVGSVLPD